MSITPARQALDDCFLHDRDRLPHAEAISILQSRLPRIAPETTLSLEKACGHVLACGVSAPDNIPSTNNSAVDGYAFNWQDYITGDGNFRLATRIAAGDLSPRKIVKGKAARIFTGAPMPAGADSVAMQEDCQSLENGVFIPPGLKAGANMRKAGEDVAKGDIILSPGQLLRPQDIAAIASTGATTVGVYSPLRVILFSSGNELLRPGTAAKPGQVYDANHFMLASLAKNLPVELVDGGILPDDRIEVEKALLGASKEFDVILTSGGASMGEEDHMIATLDKHGTRSLWQLAIKPGRPMTFGTLGDAAWFGLPGNPVASFVCFLLYVRPSLLQLGGCPWREPARFMLPASFAIRNKKPHRREFYRAIMTTTKTGETVLDKFDRDGSGLITGLRKANGLAEIPEDTTSIKTGEPVRFIPFTEFGIV